MNTVKILINKIAKYENIVPPRVDSKGNDIQVSDYLRNIHNGVIGRVVSWMYIESMHCIAFSVEFNATTAGGFQKHDTWHANNVELYKRADEIPLLCDAPIGVDRNGSNIFDGDTLIYISGEYVAIGKVYICESFPASPRIDLATSVRPNDYAMIEFDKCILYERAKKEE